MTTVLLLQTSRWRDAADDAALIAAAAALDPIRVMVATADPERTERVTGLPAIAAHRTAILRTMTVIDAVVVLGGRPLSSHARDQHLFSLPELYAVLTAFRTYGKQLALVGVGAGPLTTRRDAFCARQLVGGSAFTVLDGPTSVGYLSEAGAPSPMRVGADLAWLQLQTPPHVEATDDQVWCPLTRADVTANGGPAAVAEQLVHVMDAVARRLGHDNSVTVQAWRCGVAAGEDLEAMSELAVALTARGLRAEVAPPPISLEAEKDLLSRAAFCVCADPHAMMTAEAAGVPLLAWPHDSVAEAAALRLAMPMLPGDAGDCVDAAFAHAGTALPLVRTQVAAASEVADLLKMLLSHGVDMPRLHQGSSHDQIHGLRPTGVMR